MSARSDSISPDESILDGAGPRNRVRSLRFGPGRRALATVVAIVALFWMLDALVAWRAYRDERAEVRRAALNEAVAAAGSLQQFVRSELAYLQAISLAPAVVAGDTEVMQEYFERASSGGALAANADSVSPGSVGAGAGGAGLAWIDADGALRVPGTLDLGLGPPEVALAEVLQVGLSSRQSHVEVTAEGLARGPVSALVYPTLDGSGAFSGMVVRAIPLAEMANRLASALALPDLVVTDRHGHVIFDEGAVVEELTAADATVLARASAPSGVLASSAGVRGGDDHLVTYARIEDAGWTVFIDESRAGAYGPFRRNLQQQLVIVGVLGLVAIVCAGLIARGLERHQTTREALLRSERYARRRAQSLERLATELGPLVSTAEIAGVVAKLGLEASGAMHAGVGLIDGATGELVMEAFEQLPDLDPQSTPPVERSPTSGVAMSRVPMSRVPMSTVIPATDAVRSGRAVYLHDREAMVQAYPHLAANQESQRSAVAALPMPTATGRPFGLLVLSFATDQTFTEGDQRFLEALAAHGALAIERAHLHDQEQTLRAQAENRQRELATRTRQLQLAQQAAGIGHWTRDPVTDESWWSLETYDLFGIDRAEPEFLAELTRRIHPEDADAFVDAREPQLTGEAVSIEYRYDHPALGERWIHQDAATITDDGVLRVVGLRYDVTERIAGLESERRRRARAEQLAQVASRLAGAETSADVADVVAGDVASAVRGLAALVVRDLENPDALTVLSSPGWPAPGEIISVHDPSPFAAVVRTGTPILADSPEELARRCPGDPTLALRPPDHGAFAAFPVEIGGFVNGTLAVSFVELTELDTELVSTLRALAALCGQALARTRRYDVEHDLVVGIQRSLIPEVLTSMLAPRWAQYRPAHQTAGVGGDWYDVWPAGGHRTVFVIGDVVGHGVSAAIAMSQLRGAARAIGIDAGPAALLGRLDGLVGRGDDTWMATVACLVHDEVDGTLRYSLAGHPYPLVRLASGELIELDRATDMPLGPRHGHRRPEATLAVPDGALLVAYTDGLVELRGTNLVERAELLRSVITTIELASGHDPCEQLLNEMLVEGGIQRDDVAVVCASLAPCRGEVVDLLQLPAVPSSLAEARARLRGTLEQLSLSRRDVDDLLVVVGEAATNAVEHGAADRPGVVSVELAWAASSSTVTVTVRDDGRWRTPRHDPRRGRGLTIMRELTDALDVHHDERGTTVTIRKHFQRPNPALVASADR